MIYLLSIYLVYKGVEIFQVAFVSQSHRRKFGMILGGVMIAGAIGVGAIAVAATELMARGMADTLNKPFIP